MLVFNSLFHDAVQLFMIVMLPIKRVNVERAISKTYR